jgi:hypothetical protein
MTDSPCYFREISGKQRQGQSNWPSEPRSNAGTRLPSSPGREWALARGTALCGMAATRLL